MGRLEGKTAIVVGAGSIRAAALFLASDESKYVTGIELVVDGGITLKVT